LESRIQNPEFRRRAKRGNAGCIRPPRPNPFWILNSGFWILILLSASLAADTRLRVEFTEKGDCSVITMGPTGRSSVRYPRLSADWRCAVTSVGDAAAVDLEVVAPAGGERPASSFPQLAWTEENGRWVGRAPLPSPPSFVRLVPAGSARERWLDASVLAAAAAATLWALAVARGRA
jgi:hypothetical protein